MFRLPFKCVSIEEETEDRGSSLGIHKFGMHIYTISTTQNLQSQTETMKIQIRYLEETKIRCFYKQGV